MVAYTENGSCLIAYHKSKLLFYTIYFNFYNAYRKYTKWVYKIQRLKFV